MSEIEAEGAILLSWKQSLVKQHSCPLSCSHFGQCSPSFISRVSLRIGPKSQIELIEITVTGLQRSGWFVVVFLQGIVTGVSSPAHGPHCAGESLCFL